MNHSWINIVLVGLWLVAGLIALSFSVGNARIWTSISTGFFLVFLSEGSLLMPLESEGLVVAMFSVVGLSSIFVISYGFMEYYVFSRTLETSGEKWVVYAAVAAVLLVALGFMGLNISPRAETIRHIRIVENTTWVALTLINMDLLWKIRRQLAGSPIARGFTGFLVVFFCFFLWRGSMLYLQVWGFDPQGQALGAGASSIPASEYPFRVGLSTVTYQVGSVLSSLSAGGVFLYLARAMR